MVDSFGMDRKQFYGILMMIMITGFALYERSLILWESLH